MSIGIESIGLESIGAEDTPIVRTYEIAGRLFSKTINSFTKISISSVTARQDTEGISNYSKTSLSYIIGRLDTEASLTGAKKIDVGKIEMEGMSNSIKLGFTEIHSQVFVKGIWVSGKRKIDNGINGIDSLTSRYNIRSLMESRDILSLTEKKKIIRIV